MQELSRRPDESHAGGPGTSPAERKARQFLAEGRFRKARDEIKPLLKSDRARFLPLLIEANCGLAREMLGKGLSSEAEQVLAYLRTIAPASTLLLLESEMANRSGRADHSLPALAHLLADPSASLSEADKRRLADRLVAAFEPIPPEGDAGRLSTELAAIHSAFRCLCKQEYDQAIEALRPLPHGSAFSQWKIFLKGLAAFYRGEIAKATRCLRDLPADSVPAKAARPYLLLMAEDPHAAVARGVPDPLVEDICRLLDQPRLGPVLTRAERLWREQKSIESYRLARTAIDGFPSQTLDWVGVLSEFYLNAAHSLPWELAEDYVEYLEESLSYYNPKNAHEPLLIHRLCFLFRRDEGHWTDDKHHLDEFLQAHERLHGRNPPLSSRAYTWLGRRLAAECESAFSPFGRSSYLSGEGKEAIHLFERSVALDPTNLDAQLGLCKVFEKSGMDSRRNRLLDSMTKRFPDDKQVLIQAGRGCLDRKAFLKALGYLERALELDRLDPAIPELLVAARILLAREHFKAGRHAKARLVLDAAMALAVDDPTNLQRSRWALLARRGLLEEVYEGKGKGDSFLAASRECAPGVEAFLFFADVTFRYYNPLRSSPSPFAKELERSVAARPRLATAAALIRIVQFWRRVKDGPDPLPAEGFVRRYLRSCARQPISPEDVRLVFDLTGPESVFTAEVSNLVHQVLRKDPSDPRFRLYRFLLERDQNASPASLEGELTAIEEEAARRGDHQTVQSTRQARTALRSRPLGPPSFDDGWVPRDDDDWEIDDDFDDEEEDRMAPDVPPEFEAELFEVIRTLGSLSGPELAQARKDLLKSVPPGVLDMLIAAAREGKLPPPPPEQRKRPLPPPPPPKRPPLPPGPRPRTPLPPDPNQPELF